jgi:hypothetical protein
MLYSSSLSHCVRPENEDDTWEFQHKDNKYTLPHIERILLRTVTLWHITVTV